MRIIIYSANYPSEENLFGDVFVHVRAKHYLAYSNDVVVVAITGNSDFEYDYEGVNVKLFHSEKSLRDFIDSWTPDVFCVHFYEEWMFDLISKKMKDIQVLVWVHGYGAMKWQRRLFEIDFGRSFFGYVRSNGKQLSALRKLIDYSNKYLHLKFVFVSNWIRSITSMDVGVDILNYSIIPNPINDSLFAFSVKTKEMRLKVLSIRPFHTRKYATDLICKTILKLSETNLFDAFEFTVVGKGRFFDKDTKAIRRFSNVKIFNNFFPNVQLPSIHDSHGVFLCPTRLDTHGVSMCEAMSSGLVCVASNNSAIPEYISHNHSGILTDNRVSQLKDALIWIAENHDVFLSMSENAAQEAREKCSSSIVIPKELSIMG